MDKTIMDEELAEKLDILYWCFEPFTLKIGKGLMPLFNEKENAPLVKKMHELRDVLVGSGKIKIVDDPNLNPMEYKFVSYGEQLHKEMVTLEEASDKILYSFENILLSDNEHILK